MDKFQTTIVRAIRVVYKWIW